MAELVLESVSKADLEKSIKLCKDKEKEFKDKEILKAKYTKMREKFEEAQKTFDEWIEKTKSMKLNTGADKTLYSEYIAGKEATLSLVELKNIQNAHISEKDGDWESLDPNNTTIEAKVDFVDKMKQVGHDFLHGKGLAKGVVTTAIGVCIAELLTQGVTSYLVSKGIMGSAMGLMGLGQLGLQALPGVLTAVGGGIAAFTGISSIVAVTAGIAAVGLAVPVITNAINKVKKKYKEAHNFDKNMQELAEKQASLS